MLLRPTFNLVDFPLRSPFFTCWRCRLPLVLVCAAGFGHDTAVHMDHLGYIVVAGCLTEQGREVLRARLSPRSVTTLYDVTKDADHARVAEEVAQQYPQGV